ncbi:DUF503 domain-containing protein [Hydrogenobacter thermophilus]|uniref:DUF503 domain-containing protein n=1 Tax=Hydrogenobacter thermophilus TaxID=940 RepID=UPI0030F942EB
MFLGVLKLELFFPENGSLKEKRYYLRSIKDRLKGNFNVSVAETDHHDLWQRSQIAVACVGMEKQAVEETLTKVRNFLDRNYPEFILSVSLEYLKV